MSCNSFDLAAKGDGTKLKPFNVFKGSKRYVEKLKKEYGNKCIIASSTSEWTDTNLTLSWTNNKILFIYTSNVSLGYIWVSFNASC